MFKASDVRTQRVHGSRVVAIAVKDALIFVLTEDGVTSVCVKKGWLDISGVPADPTAWLAKFQVDGYDTLRR
jgi:hypothetical protein